MRVWAVANQKGGVGKTTTSVALAGLLAASGKRVIMVDLDPHGSMTSYFGYDPDHLEYSVFDLFRHAQTSVSDIKDLLLPTSHEQAALLPSSTVLATLERHSPNQNGLGLVVARSLAQLWGDYDHAIIDSPPLLGVLMVNALAASQHLVIPVQTEFLALKGLERMISTLNLINHSRRHQALPYTVVPTLFDRRTQASLGALQILRDTYPQQLWSGFIPVDTRLRDASRIGVMPSQQDPSSRGVQAYRLLLKYLLESKTPSMVA
ncbi:chromosome partitioning protein [Azomonas agilis]|uniref:Chromosome partitioning protein n=1 Tax=Azomonas agilis TaxID=116849 RepID=A0A562I2K1_9GAMM|nr:ParA family protein [Azomonas agilis]TWH64934.1 chromosome partitioning protein [Azomonas agilis]